MTHRPLIAANWKMNLGRFDQALAAVRTIRRGVGRPTTIDVVVCPPMTVLARLAEVLEASPIDLGAQNVHWADSGAHTGEISPEMLRGLCRYVILGHSERRAAASSDDTDGAINRKLRASLRAGLRPILCVGEHQAQRDGGATERVVVGQVTKALDGVPPEDAARCVIAYEPIWAIGSGLAATPTDANRVMTLFIRERLAARFGRDAANRIRLLYGGSVTADNIAEFMVMPDIDGALVGGASLDPVGFVELVRNASNVSVQRSKV